MARRPHPNGLEMISHLLDRAWNAANARPAEPEHDDRPAPEPDDCAIVAALVRDYFGPHNPRASKPPFISLYGEGWPLCDWSFYGLGIAEGPPPPRGATGPDRRRTRLSFGRPEYDSGGAILTASISMGPGLGSGSVCRVRKDQDGWYLDGARIRSIS